MFDRKEEARELEQYIGSSKLDKKCIKWGRNSVTFISMSVIFN